MEPQISIILSFKDAGADFGLAIQSVFAQTFKEWELLLMDDGSRDGSLEFARSIDDPRVRVFSDGLSLNLNRRLNQLIDLARAPYIARMDADDIMHPDRLAKEYALLRENDSRTVVGTGAYSIDGASRVVGIRAISNVQRYGRAATSSFIHPTVAASAEWFRRFRYSESFIFHRSQDAELWFRSSSSSRFLTIEEPLLFYREVGNFTLDKYIGTKLGMVSLATQLARVSRIRSMFAITIEAGKLWIMALADVFGFAGWIVERRHRTLPPASIAAAQKVIERIRATPLPFFSSRTTACATGVAKLSGPAR